MVMAKGQILIVEDDRSLAEVLDYNLRRDGYETLVANDGQEGLRQARVKGPDLVLLISCCRWSMGSKCAGDCGPTPLPATCSC